MNRFHFLFGYIRNFSVSFVKIKYKFSVGEKKKKVCPYGIISFRIKYKIIVDIKANKNKYYLYQR
jgi:hypothetical protein